MVSFMLTTIQEAQGVQEGARGCRDCRDDAVRCQNDQKSLCQRLQGCPTTVHGTAALPSCLFLFLIQRLPLTFFFSSTGGRGILMRRMRSVNFPLKLRGGRGTHYQVSALTMESLQTWWCVRTLLGRHGSSFTLPCSENFKENTIGLMCRGACRNV